ncbi:MAG: hypothetical protein V1922_03005 [bacterium]
MKKIKIGILLGIVAGIIDVIPMLLQKLTWDANLSAFSLWVISGYLIANTKSKLKGVLKGISISFLVLIPSAILIGWKEPIALIPIFVMTFILGALLGFFIDKQGK